MPLTPIFHPKLSGQLLIGCLWGPEWLDLRAEQRC